jgi:hypothetical protein
VSDIQLYIDPECRLSKVPYKVPNNTHYVLLEDYENLKSDLQMEKDNEDRLVRMWQRANNEIHGLNSQVAALIDENARLKAEVERLRKAGDAVCESPYLLETDPAVIAWRAAKEGKQS